MMVMMMAVICDDDRMVRRNFIPKKDRLVIADGGQHTNTKHTHLHATQHSIGASMLFLSFYLYFLINAQMRRRIAVDRERDIGRAP